ncbi:host specificity protein [Congregibacter litoralis]|uniref:2,4-dihydroxyhept-2-ene-1,7-dioic acid aldolase n=1 Tax=Congregibacter litoralis KT71 TaxID=314285 RepID=A4ADK9_9GAMM|nr:host specificity protein [Congregibacter litoralis]EAQ95898.1 2,4-dihydroxyhept-2-ene-1,7-dioic acid aldolase [Congregibacter litoralis KT71]
MGIRQLFAVTTVAASLLCAPGLQSAQAAEQTGSSGRALIDLWAMGEPAFGEYVTQSRGGNGDDESAHAGPSYTVQTGLDLAANPLLDFAFLSLEQQYEAEAAQNVAEGIRKGAGDAQQLPLLVRIPPIAVDGEAAARSRVKELLAMGANGVVIPHIMSADEARAAVSFFEGANVWSPDNPEGDIVAMLIVEDPEVFAELEEIADLPGFSALVCGIGSLTSALDGDREAAEKINQQVLAESKRVGKPNLTTVSPESVAQRVEQGFLGLLAYGPESQEAIRRGRLAAGR